MTLSHSINVRLEPMLVADDGCPSWNQEPGFRTAVGMLVLLGSLGLVGCGEKRELAATPAVAPAPPAATNWPMTRGGPALTGHAAALVPLDPVIAWTFASSGPVTAEAAIVDGRVYVGSDQGTLHCLEAETGREIWRFETGDAIAAAPAVRGGRVFLSSNDGRLYAVDVATGAELWRYAAEEKMSSGAVAIGNPSGTGDWVLLNGYDGTTRVFAAADGKLVWSYQTEDYINGSPAVVEYRFLVFGGCDAQLHVVNLADGTLVRKIPTDAQIPASIATFGTMAYCGNYANQAVAFDVAAGTVAWIYEDRALPFFSSPAVNDRLVLIGSRDKNLHAIDRQTGAGVWKFATGGRVEGSPVVFGDGVVFASSDGRLYAAGLETGAEIWRLDLGESLLASPAFGARQIVIGGEKGTVFAIRARITTPTHPPNL